ncbi:MULTISPECIES: alkaline phosphatase family protein [Dyella]|uniref:Alkaline phosphatase family protein n=2 Tax=Dyella TaxID=231454 RepID=A0A4R0YJR6_9GAMM|nr:MULTISPECIES: alkaline phosphatase family protein [Dyella]TBR36121.1 alkaline phosphatase family protein [Dyella terrae]TCI06170.1 alkaline phosphatase family protein [Dyella soli]
MLRPLLRYLALALLALSPLGAHAAPHPRVIVFVWDGMRPDAVSAEDTPNLLALAKRGTWFDDNHSTYPTFTMANASTFATGAFPGPLGFYGNRFWATPQAGMKTPPSTRGTGGDDISLRNPVYTEDDMVLRALDKATSGELLELPTLFMAAQRAGLKTAAVGKSGAAFLQNRQLGNDANPDRDGVLLDEKIVLPLSFAKELQQAGYPLPRTAPNVYTEGVLALREDNGGPTDRPKPALLKDNATSDATAGADTPPTAANAWMMKAYLEEILPRHRPDLSVVWLRNPDTTQHIYGVGSPEFHLALQAQDALLGQLEAKLKELGMAEDTNIIVVSDHGHSNIAGPRELFPLRQINDGRVTGIDNDWGYSVSGGVRMAHEMTRDGLIAFDGQGCVYAPVMSGLRADGSQLMPTRYDDDGRICGKPGPYTWPAYPVPEQLPRNAFVLAPNGGTEYFYQPEHNAELVKRAVRFLQSREYVATVFVAKRYGALPGTLPAEQVHLEHPGRGPDIIVSYAWDADAAIQGFRGTEYSTVFPELPSERGEHGSFSPIDVHNTLLAAGPGFRTGFKDTLPSGNVDVAPTVAALLGLALPRAQGRVLHESLTGALGRPVESYTTTPSALRPTQVASGLETVRIDGSKAKPTNFSFVVQLKQLRNADGATWTYFDQASAERH